MLFRHQDFVHQRRIAEQNKALVEKCEPRGIAEVFFQVAKKIERAAEAPVNAADEGNFPRTRNGMERTRRHGLHLTRRNEKAKARLQSQYCSNRRSLVREVTGQL